MELITGVDMAKKSLPKTLAKEIELKKKARLKQQRYFIFQQLKNEILASQN